MSDCTVQFYCPPMAIEKLPNGLHRTAAEPMRCSVTLPYSASDGWRGYPDANKELTISPVTIPPTLTRPTGLLQWTVDACVGEGPGCMMCNGKGTIGMKYFDDLERIPCPSCEGKFTGNRVRVELPEERVALHWTSETERFDFYRLLRAFEDHDLTPIERSQFVNGKWPIALIAEPIDATVTLWLADGRTFKGIVTFPEVKIDNPLFSPVAEETVTTGGELTEVKP